MRKSTTWTTVVIFALVYMVAAVAVAGEREFVGATKCKTCHNSAKKGKMYDIWLESAHSKAYEVLASEKAKDIAKYKDIEDPQKSDDCLKCHVTGHGAAAELLGDKYSAEEGVTCESCHGAGGDYWNMKVMKGISAGEQDPAEVGLIKPDRKTCVGCHNKNSPTYKEFKFEEYWPKIEHKLPTPEDAAAGK